MLTDSRNTGMLDSARLVAQAALVLAERAYADGNPEDAAHLVDVAHRLFGATFDLSIGGVLSH